MKRLAQGSTVLAALALLLLAPCATAQVVPASADEVLLREQGVPTDGASLLEFVRTRAGGTATSEKLAGLIKQLGADLSADRERACAGLLAIGPPAIPSLRQAVKDPDVPRAAALAERCLRTLERNSASTSAAALRVLAARKPQGAAEAILQFLPSAEDETVLEEARAALALVAFHEGRIDPALEQALKDQAAVRRVVVLDVLCQQARDEPRPLLRRLLRDPAASVRLRAGLALAAGGEAQAIETLIDVLGELPLPRGRQAEEFLSTLAGDLGPKVILADDDLSRKNCREAWRKWWQQPPDNQTGAALMEEVRKRTLDDANRVKLQLLVDQLGDDDFGVREKASEDLKNLGPLTLPLLRVAARSTDAEVKKRAIALLPEVDKGKVPVLNPVIPRLLAVRRASGAAGALLAFLPFAEDEAVAGEIQQALNMLAGRDGPADGALVRAIEGAVPSRRAAAGQALCHRRDPELAPALHRLLKDPDSGVRMRVALSLAQHRDRSALPVLIALVGEMPAEQASPIEDYLHWLSTDRAPPEMSGDATPKKRQEAWAGWWSAQGEKFELPDRPVLLLPGRILGYTLLVHAQNNQVVELDQAGKVRWTIGNLLGPQDARVLPGERVLIAEYNGRRVTERNHKGEILWQKALNTWPINAQRLPDGRTFIAARNLLLEVDRTGREVLSIARPASDVMNAWKTREGQFVVVTNQGVCLRLDRTGKEVKQFRLQGVASFGNDLLANGNVLIPLSWQNRVTEYDMDGKVVWDANVPQPLAATRLPNGNTLVVCQQWPPLIVELDRKGKKVAEIKSAMFASRVRRR